MSRRLLLILIALIIICGLGAVWAVSRGGDSSAAMLNLNSCAEPELTINQTVDCLAGKVNQKLSQNNNPQTFLTVVDRQVMSSDQKLILLCHTAMHKAGRQFARDQRLTLADLQNYLPASDNSNCPAGFAHGMISALGVNQNNVNQIVNLCARQTQRDQQYSCAHGVGHALSRYYPNDKDLRQTAIACLKLRGATARSWCAQGMYHDYVIAGGGFYQLSEARSQSLSQSFCRNQPRIFAKECFFRATQANNQPRINTPQPLVNSCRNLSGRTKNDCLTGVATSTIRDSDIVRVCSQLNSDQAIACIAGSGLIIPDYDISSQSDRQALIYRKTTLNPLIEQCSQMPSKKAESQCTYWIAFRSTRSIAADITPGQALDICARVRSSLYRSCERGILDSTQPINNARAS